MTCIHDLYTRPCTLGFVLAPRIARFACQGRVEGPTTAMIEQGSVTAAWVIYTMMFGYPISTNDTNEFDNQTACQIYLHTRSRPMTVRNSIVSQFKMWLTQYPELYEAVQAGNDSFTPRVERALAERAIGYEYTWEEEEISPVTGQKQMVRKHKYFPPEVSAIKYHLNNRAKDRWRDVQNVEVETKRRTSGEILAGIYERLAKLKEQGYLTTIDIPALPAPQDDSDIED